jgi:hypothetical protein
METHGEAKVKAHTSTAAPPMSLASTALSTTEAFERSLDLAPCVMGRAGLARLIIGRRDGQSCSQRSRRRVIRRKKMIDGLLHVYAAVLWMQPAACPNIWRTMERPVGRYGGSGWSVDAAMTLRSPWMHFWSGPLGEVALTRSNAPVDSVESWRGCDARRVWRTGRATMKPSGSAARTFEGSTAASSVMRGLGGAVIAQERPECSVAIGGAADMDGRAA